MNTCKYVDMFLSMGACFNSKCKFQLKSYNISLVKARRALLIHRFNNTNDAQCLWLYCPPGSHKWSISWSFLLIVWSHRRDRLQTDTRLTKRLHYREWQVSNRFGVGLAGVTKVYIMNGRSTAPKLKLAENTLLNDQCACISKSCSVRNKLQTVVN